LSTNGNGAAATDGAATNGKARYQHDKVRVAIIGVGNCANSFVQGVHHYRDADPKVRVPGLMHVDLGGYHVSDIEFTCAFDVNRTKVGKDLGEAIGPTPTTRSSSPSCPRSSASPFTAG
jgi:myo-inositol-1-phosphate synthase